VEPVADGTLDALRSAIVGEPDRRTRATLLIAAGYCSRYAGSTRDTDLLTGYLTHRNRLLRTAAAIALTHMHAPTPPAEVLAVLDDAARPGPRVIGAWPWNSGDLHEYAGLLRRALMTPDERYAAFVAAVEAGDEEQAERFARNSFWWLFSDGDHDGHRPWLPDELDERRRTVLGRFVTSTDGTSMWYWDDADGLGLPSGVADTRRLLGLDSGPLDTTVTLADRRVPVWAAFRAARVGADPATVAGDERAVAARVALDGLTADLRVAVVRDALGGAYQLGSRSIVDADGDRDWAAENDHTSRYLCYLADLLDGAGPAGLAAAREIAATTRTRRDAAAGVMAALVLVRAGEHGPDVAPLVALDQPPVSTYRLALREVYRHLPVALRRELLGEPELYGYQAHRDPRGEVRRWTVGSGWDWVDLLPGDEVAELVLAAVREWERHRAAGDDRGATPVVGTVTSSIAERSADEPFPREQAIALFGQAGAAAVPVIDAALADGSITDHALLAAARAAATGEAAAD
jgi:hypothetical protein